MNVIMSYSIVFSISSAMPSYIPLKRVYYFGNFCGVKTWILKLVSRLCVTSPGWSLREFDVANVGMPVYCCALATRWWPCLNPYAVSLRKRTKANRSRGTCSFSLANNRWLHRGQLLPYYRDIWSSCWKCSLYGRFDFYKTPNLKMWTLK